MGKPQKFVTLFNAHRCEAFRVSSWINTDTMSPMYGVQARPRKGMWCHVVINQAPFITASKPVAEEMVRMLRDLKASDASSPSEKPTLSPPIASAGGTRSPVLVSPSIHSDREV